MPEEKDKAVETKRNIITKQGVVLTDKDIPDDHLSPSQINTFDSCQFKWYQRYVLGQKIAPDSAMMLGSSVDDAITTNYSQKIESTKDMPIDDVRDAFVTSVDIRKTETDIKPDENIGDIKNYGIKMVDAYYNEITNSVQPTGVQTLYDILFAGVEWTLKIILDVEEAKSIRDTKTTARSPEKFNDKYILPPYNHFQLVSYAIGRQFKEGKIKGLELYNDFIVKNKAPKTVTVKGPALREGDIKFFKTKTSTTYEHMKKIRNGELPPLTNRTHMLCSKRKCGFWSICEKVNGVGVKP